MIDTVAAFRMKTELLCKGLYLDKTLLDHYSKHGISYGRKGGAGPLGGRYFILEDNKTLVNVALWDKPQKTNLVLREKIDNFFEVYDVQNELSFGKLKLIPNPKYYSPEYITSDGIQMKKIALSIACFNRLRRSWLSPSFWASTKSAENSSLFSILLRLFLFVLNLYYYI